MVFGSSVPRESLNASIARDSMWYPVIFLERRIGKIKSLWGIFCQGTAPRLGSGQLPDGSLRVLRQDSQYGLIAEDTYPARISAQPTPPSGLDTSHAALEASSSGESIEFVQEPLGLLCHKDANLFPLEGERYPESAQVNIRDIDFHVERLLVDPRGRG